MPKRHRPPQQSYFLNSYNSVQPCSPATLAAGVAPPPLPSGAQIPTNQSPGPQGNPTRRRFAFPQKRPRPEDQGTNYCPFESSWTPGQAAAVSMGFPKYNILMILCDQMRAPRWLPKLPNPPAPATCVNGTATAQKDQLALDAVLPNLANLRNMSFNLQNYYGAATNCTPNRACLATGLYTAQNCMYVTDDPPSSLNNAYPPALQPYVQKVNNVATAGQGFATIGDVLTSSAALLKATNGAYDCVWIGKWHLSDNPEESNSAFSCSGPPSEPPNDPGGNGPADYGFQDVLSACLPTPPAGSTTYPGSEFSGYPSPNGQDNQGNSGEFQGNQSLNPVGTPASGSPPYTDVPAYGSGSTYPQDSYPPGPPANNFQQYLCSFKVQPPGSIYDYCLLAPPEGYNQLNDAAITYAFNNWLTGIANRNIPNKWFAAVSFINPHDISQFPYGFGVMNPHMQGTQCGLFCTPPDGGPGAHGSIIATSGFQPPEVPAPGAIMPTTFGSVDSSTLAPGLTNPETEQTNIAAFPYNPPGAAPASDPTACALYNTNQPPDTLWPNAPSSLSAYQKAWNGDDIPTAYTLPNPPTVGSGKPNLQSKFRSDTTNLTGQIVDTGDGGTDEGWYIFLNYYLWMQSCLDQQLGLILFSPGNSTGLSPGLQYSPFWTNTVIIFTSDHGEYGGSHGLHAKGAALYDEVMNIPLYISFPNPNSSTGRQGSNGIGPSNPVGGVPLSFTCSAVDILPFIYTLALGNESWRGDPSDIINYLNGRESIMDAVMGGSSGAVQRRIAQFPAAAVAYPQPMSTQCPGLYYQPYVLHTNDEYFFYNNYTDGSGLSYPPHAVAFRTVDATISTKFSLGPFGGGKVGIYSNWDPNLNPITINTPGYSGPNPQQFEFYNYQQSAQKDDGSALAVNPSETGNDYWSSGQSSGQAYKYLQSFSPSSISGGGSALSAFQTELTSLYQQIQIAHANAFNLWQLYSFQYTTPAGTRPPGINCQNTGTPYFTLTAGATTPVSASGGTTTSTISITGYNTFTGQVTLSVVMSSLPCGISVMLSANMIGTGSNSTATVTVGNCNSMALSPGPYYITISAVTTTGPAFAQLAVIVVQVESA